MLTVFPTKQFKKDLKRIRRSGTFDDTLLEVVIDTLASKKVLAEKYRDHSLKGSAGGLRECHIKPDLLLVYKIYDERLLLELIRLGSHSELFD